jgi:hypothetical protein
MIDKTAPVTTDDYGGSTKYGVWQNGDQTVNLSPTDTLSYVDDTLYCIDQTDTCDPDTSGTVVLVTPEGVNYVRYYSIDNVGNIEDVKSVEVMIDHDAQTDNGVVVVHDVVTTVTLGNVTLDIDASVDNTVGISVVESPTHPNSGVVGIPALGKFVEITAPLLLGNMNSVLIKLSYTDAEVAAAGIDESTLRLYYYNTATSAWDIFDAPNGGVDTVNNYVWAITNHFSAYGAFGSAPPAPPAPAPPAPVAGSSIGGGGGGGSTAPISIKFEGNCINKEIIATVVNIKDNPVDGANVTVVKDRHLLSETKTGADGKVSFTFSDVGRYTFRATAGVAGSDSHYLELVDCPAQPVVEVGTQPTPVETTQPPAGETQPTGGTETGTGGLEETGGAAPTGFFGLGAGQGAGLGLIGLGLLFALFMLFGKKRK